MLYLSENDIQSVVNMKDVIDAIDTAYEIDASNLYHMPQRMHVSQEKNKLLLMPCLTEDVIGTKLLTLFPENTNIPVIQGIVVLNSSETGKLIAILDGTYLTSIRTGAVGGSAVRHLAKESASKVAIIGTGVQGLYQAIAACSERPITDVYLYNRTKEKLPTFISQLESLVGESIRLHVADSVEEAITDAEIIITCTRSYDPVLPNDKDLLKDKLIIGIGSYQPSMQEFPEVLYNLADTILVDTEHAIKESGDLINPVKKGWIKQNTIQRMSAYLSNEIKPNLGNTVVFKSTGMALFDVVVANTIYQKALDKKTGTVLE